MIDFIATSYINLYDKENIVLEICSNIEILKSKGCEVIDISFIPLTETKELLTLYKIKIKDIKKFLGAYKKMNIVEALKIAMEQGKKVRPKGQDYWIEYQNGMFFAKL